MQESDTFGDLSCMVEGRIACPRAEIKRGDAMRPTTVEWLCSEPRAPQNNEF